MPLPHFIPADLKLIRDAFDHDDFIFELKMDGFRALAHVGPDETRLVSRKGNVFKTFPALATSIHVDLDCEAVLDGEIVISDSDGRPQFYGLLKRPGLGEPVFFYSFDLLWLNGEDLRARPLIERKRLLRSIVPEQPSVLLYADHIERNGVEFFRADVRAGSGGHCREAQARVIRREVVQDSESELFAARRTSGVV